MELSQPALHWLHKKTAVVYVNCNFKQNFMRTVIAATLISNSPWSTTSQKNTYFFFFVFEYLEIHQSTVHSCFKTEAVYTLNVPKRQLVS